MDLVETKDQAPTTAAVYDKMGDRIRHNSGEQFGGAFVITPPGGGSLESLFICDPDPIIYWAALKSIVQQQLDAIETNERRTAQGFHR